MQGFDVEINFVAEIPAGTEIFDHAPALESCSSPMVLTFEIRCGYRYFVPIDRGVSPCDSGPRVRVAGGFAGEVAGVEFFESRVDVLGVEQDGRRHTAVEVGLDEAEQLTDEPLLRGHVGTSENKAVATSRDDLD